MLKPSNYSIWAIRMQIILEANDLWEMIEPLEITQADNKKDKIAIAFLYQALPKEQLLQITKHKIAKAIWEALKTRHIGEERVQQARLQTLKSDFEMLQIKEDEKIDTFTEKLTTLVNKVASLGHTIEDQTLVRKLLNAVPDMYLQIVASIEQYSDLSEITMKEAIGRLMTYEERIKYKKGKQVDNQEKLMFIRHESKEKYFRGHGRGKHRFSQGKSYEKFKEERKDGESSYRNFNRKNFKKSSYNTIKLQCYQCKKIWHLAPNCPQRTKANEQSNLVEDYLEPTLLMAILEDSDEGNKVKKLKNKSVLIKALEDITPYEAIKQRKPNLEKLRVFGCIAYAKVPSQRLTKLDDRSSRMTKKDANGNIIKNKARLVAKGYIQEHGKDFEEVFAPVARMETIRLLLAIAANNKQEVHHLDVKSAFLHEELKEEVYVTQPKGFMKREDNGKVYRLIKALYGLRQAPRVWNIKLDNTLKSLDLKKCAPEQATYTKTSRDSTLLIGVYVDDLIITAMKVNTVDDGWDEVIVPKPTDEVLGRMSSNDSMSLPASILPLTSPSTSAPVLCQMVQQELPSQATSSWSGSKIITLMQEVDDIIKKCIEVLPVWTGSKKLFPHEMGITLFRSAWNCC
uniref:Zinc finger, CCHC-type n=1 Tax=Tanacetum cinerariifolium TaxID=118510 RepID=A0A6L2P673_TANCI|nr:zinc finger, CCHC-type [Tanacetum cinerariifolium]